ncbi:CvpA family protein [Arboricoccus pini]|nr:CvpA family protein [Arboricoccus pini]
MNQLPFTAFDIAVVAVIVISALLSLSRGIAREIASLLSWIGAAAVAWFAYEPAKPIMTQITHQELFVDLGTAALVFVIPLIILKIIFGMIAANVEGSRLTTADKLFGLVYGFGRGALLVCLAYLLGTLILERREFPTWVTTAYLEPPVARGASIIRAWLPGDIRERGQQAGEEAMERAQRYRNGATVDDGKSKDGPSATDRGKLEQLFPQGGQSQ